MRSSSRILHGRLGGLVKSSNPIIHATNLSSSLPQLTTSQRLNSHSESEMEWQKRRESKYITKSAFNSLHREDKESLREVLFTDSGIYAIEKGYLSVDQFLSLPIESRDYLARFFYDVSPLYKENELVKQIVDSIFAPTLSNRGEEMSAELEKSIKKARRLLGKEIEIDQPEDRTRFRP